MTTQVIKRPPVYDALCVTEHNLPHAARMLGDDVMTSLARQYIGAYLVKRGLDIHTCTEAEFKQQYIVADPPEIDVPEIVAALEWARQELGKHTRPSPVDELLSKLK